MAYRRIYDARRKQFRTDTPSKHYRVYFDDGTSLGTYARSGADAVRIVRGTPYYQGRKVTRIKVER